MTEVGRREPGRRVGRSPAEWLGLARSLAIYWRPGRQRGLRALYAPWVRRGDLVFDIGAHVGDRTRAFAALGARVVAIEPQPLMAAWLERTVARHPRVTVVRDAVGATSGQAELAIARLTPTVSTLADSWRKTIGAANAGFQSVRWDRHVSVNVTTLDRLIAGHGMPRFCKIDVEGFEAEVLRGATEPIPALSLEFVAGALDVAVDCVDILRALGPFEFNAIVGEQRTFVFDRWRTSGEIVTWLRAGAAQLPSGDLYARQTRVDRSSPEIRSASL